MRMYSIPESTKIPHFNCFTHLPNQSKCSVVMSSHGSTSPDDELETTGIDFLFSETQDKLSTAFEATSPFSVLQFSKRTIFSAASPRCAKREARSKLKTFFSSGFLLYATLLSELITAILS